MTNFLPFSPKRVMTVGDWHGNLAWAQKVIAWAATEQGTEAIVHAGDFGYWVNSPATDRYLKGVSDTCIAAGVPLAFIDGNHEDHSRLAEHNIIGGEAVELYPHVWFLPRGYRWEWNDFTWMALGGAHSVDRQARTPLLNWWPEEHLTPEQVEYASRPGGVDVVVAHDCPEGVAIPGLTSGWPYTELVAAQQHRMLVRDVFDAVEPMMWIHGHYHVSYAAGLHGSMVRGLADDKCGSMNEHSMPVVDEGEHVEN